jgi:calcineurin-like phosphoesterase family protein
MTDIYCAGDHHFGHSNILKFTDKSGELIRGKHFKDINHHDTTIINNHNSIVRPQDHVYFLGDVVINKRYLHYIKYMNGHKRLVLGNHDIFAIEKYLEAGFEKIYGVRVFPAAGYILSHIPLHPDCLKARDWNNLHGHLHGNSVLLNGRPDPSYRCLSLEHTNYFPVLIMT